MNGTKRKAIIFGIVFICLVLFAGCLIAAKIGHDCIGDNCTVCGVIDLAQTLFSGVTLLAVATVFILALRFCINFISFFVRNRLFYTLILLKVKLSD